MDEHPPKILEAEGNDQVRPRQRKTFFECIIIGVEELRVGAEKAPEVERTMCM